MMPFRSRFGILQSIYDSNNTMLSDINKNAIYMSMKTIFRGPFTHQEIRDQIVCLKSKNKQIKRIFEDKTLNFVNTIHHNIPSEHIIGTFIGNSTSIKNIFTYILEQFKKMLKKKADIHHFTELMEETELNFAEINL